MTPDFRIFTEPQQGATYDDLLAVAKKTEQLGFDGFFRSDHFLKMGGVSGLPGPTDAWTTLAGLARETSRIRLGTLMTSATFRHPSILAVQVAQVDQMSGGRVELGIGSGWYKEEHTAFGIPFPTKLFDRFEEQLAIVTGLWDTPKGVNFSFKGEHYELTDCPAFPKPVQTQLPIIIGGSGPTRTPAFAARFANEYNAAFPALDGLAQRFQTIRDACEEYERNPADLVHSAALVVCVGRDEAEFRRRAERIGRNPGELREHGIAGTPTEAIDQIGRFSRAGVERFYLQVLDLHDLEHIELIASDVVAQL
ncbi:LLM class F420-dependent oxidoreductase [Hoyosella rhizosphaerae]|uniref:LLM class F420-dependent oxidoreductase n=1 Tax=Hoyosella rhizosphaerae TaxID=1755582 RepID=UPI00166CF540|nr:LLM class F420-dependent oxidoreductase [Hoyosella rhizosphaerae]MBN4927560.1 LLM class F420-dependent oxidoreductase [Hoyosella rhizosphaerae]